MVLGAAALCQEELTHEASRYGGARDQNSNQTERWAYGSCRYLNRPRLLGLCAVVTAFDLHCINLWPQFFREVKATQRPPLRSQHSVECRRLVYSIRWGGGRREPRHKNMPGPTSIPTPFRRVMFHANICPYYTESNSPTSNRQQKVPSFNVE